ncbi:hypothetical protein [Rubritalea tangerina]
MNVRFLTLFSIAMLCSLSIMKAQTLIAPNHGIAELKYLQADDGSDGSVVRKTVRQVDAEVQAGQEVYIPLGIFAGGAVHEIHISCEGYHAHSTGRLMFVPVYGAVKPTVYLEQKHTYHSRFKVLSYAHGPWVGLVLQYYNAAPAPHTNPVRVQFETAFKNKWYFNTPSTEQLNSLVEIEPQLHIASGQSYEGYSLPSGVYVDGNLVSSEASAPATVLNYMQNEAVGLSFMGGTASGNKSFAASGAGADGDYSFAFGQGSSALGDYSFALGLNADVEGDYAFAFGDGVEAEDYSVAFGQNSAAYGSFSAAFGGGVRTNSGYSTAFGRSNVAYGDLANRSVWMGDDQHSVLEVGIGADSLNRKNAVTVYQDGSVELGKATASDNAVPLHIKADGSSTFNGPVILAEPQGDISMGIYGQ